MVTPDGWHEVRLGDVGVLRGGVGFPLRFQGRTEGDIPFYKVSDMNLPGNEIHMSDSNNYVSEADTRSLGARPLPAGSIIFAKVGAAVFLERKRILTTQSCIDNNMMALIPDVGRCDTAFLHFALQMVRFSDLVSATALPSINASGVAGVTIELPPRREQEAIAEALSDADAAIEALDALIAKKRGVKQAAMQQLLTGRTRLPGFSGEWEDEPIGSLFTFQRTTALSRAQLSEDGEIGYIHYGDIHSKWSTHLDLNRQVLPGAGPSLVATATRVIDGDLVLADASEDLDGVGKGVEVMGVGGRSVVAGLHTVLLRPRAATFAPGFVGYVPSMPAFRTQARTLAAGLKVYGLSKASLRQIVVRVPTPDEQAQIALCLMDMDDEIEALVAERDKMRLVKQGMMQELLSGRVRLV